MNLSETQHSALSTPHFRKGPHRVAMFASLVALPLLLSGAQVTTNRAGMAVWDWPTTFGENMFLFNFFRSSWGVFIEHRHRLFGTALGLAAIVLAAWFLVAERRRWLKVMGVAALLAVIGQGLLGGRRVQLNSTTFAGIHGCTGQAVFALLVALCVVTGRTWTAAGEPREDSVHLRRRSLVTLALIYAQIVAGALLRHFGVGLALHILLAAAVWGHAAALAWRVERARSDLRGLVGPARAMGLAVTLQVGLGVAAWWLLRPFDGLARPVSTAQGLVRNLHVLNGALLLGSGVTLALLAFRLLAPGTEDAPVPTPSLRELEAVA